MKGLKVMYTVRLAALTGSMVVALAVAGIARAAEAPIKIEFEKNCPVLTCVETASSPVGVDTVVTPVKLSGSAFHYTAVETLSSSDGSVTVSLSGVLNFARNPNLTVVHGTVVEGSWGGADLTGANVYAEATRLFDTTFGGTVWIFPASAN